MKNLYVSIIIPTFHDWSRLQLCLMALDGQSYGKENYEIVVINNDPSDKLPAGYALPENCSLLEESKPGSYAARNAGLRRCKGGLIGFTDSDCIPDKDWIRNAVNFFNNNKNFSRLGGAIIIFFKDVRPTSIELYDSIFAFPQQGYVKSGNAVTANMFSYYTVFEKIGFFDEFLQSGGDYVWGKRAQNENFSIGYSPNVKVKHPARASLNELSRKARRVGKGQSKFQGGKKKNIANVAWEALQILKPRIYEVQRIFKRGKALGIKDKVFLIFIRHYLIWIAGFSRMKHSNREKS